MDYNPVFMWPVLFAAFISKKKIPLTIINEKCSAKHKCKKSDLNFLRKKQKRFS